MPDDRRWMPAAEALKKLTNHGLDRNISASALFSGSVFSNEFHENNRISTGFLGPIENHFTVTTNQIFMSLLSFALTPFNDETIFQPDLSLQIDWVTGDFIANFLDRSKVELTSIQWHNVRFSFDLIERIICRGSEYLWAAAFHGTTRRVFDTRPTSREAFNHSVARNNNRFLPAEVASLPVTSNVRGGDGRAMTYNHPAASAKVVARYLALAGEDRAKITIASVSADLEAAYVELQGKYPAASTLEYSAREIWLVLKTL